MVIKQRSHGLDFTFYFPEEPLMHFVHCFIEISGKPVLTTIRNFPVLKSEITFNLSGSPIKGESGIKGISLSCAYSMLRGTMSVWQDIYLPEFIHLFGISFKPEFFYSLFKIAPYELNDQFIEGSLCRKEFNDVWYQMMETGSTKKRFEITQNWLMSKIKFANYKQNNLAIWTKEQCDNISTITVGQLEKLSGYSRKHLFTEFKKHTGIGIKHYRELIRFQRMINDLKTKNANDLSSLAYKHNFYDQAHLINTFKKFTGMIPSKVNDLFTPQQNVEQKGFNLTFGEKTS